MINFRKWIERKKVKKIEKKHKRYRYKGIKHTKPNLIKNENGTDEKNTNKRKERIEEMERGRERAVSKTLRIKVLMSISSYIKVYSQKLPVINNWFDGFYLFFFSLCLLFCLFLFLFWFPMNFDSFYSFIWFAFQHILRFHSDFEFDRSKICQFCWLLKMIRF